MRTATSGLTRRTGPSRTARSASASGRTRPGTTSTATSSNWRRRRSAGWRRRSPAGTRPSSWTCTRPTAPTTATRSSTKDGHRVPTKEPKDYKVQLLTREEATEFVKRPAAYLFPATFTGAVETLQRHGIVVEELREDIELDLQVYTVEKVIKANRVFQK